MRTCSHILFFAAMNLSRSGNQLVPRNVFRELRKLPPNTEEKTSTREPLSKTAILADKRSLMNLPEGGPRTSY